MKAEILYMRFALIDRKTGETIATAFAGDAEQMSTMVSLRRDLSEESGDKKRFHIARLPSLYSTKRGIVEASEALTLRIVRSGFGCI